MNTTIVPARLSNLRTWNIGLTVLHSAQALLILFLASPTLIGTTTVALCTNIAVAWLELGNRSSSRIAAM
jgi:hypothetical protein